MTNILHRALLHRAVVSIGVAFVLLANLPAQCVPTWAPGAAVPGTDGDVFAAAMWDPDGPGPRPAQAVVGGRFRVAGDVVGNGLAAHRADTGVWSAFGSGLTANGAAAEVHAILPLPGGELIAAGSFTHAGGVVANNVARWDGGAWSPVGAGTDGPVKARGRPAGPGAPARRQRGRRWYLPAGRWRRGEPARPVGRQQLAARGRTSCDRRHGRRGADRRRCRPRRRG